MEFKKTTEVLPFTKYGLTSLEDFKRAEIGVQRLEWLKRVGLSSDEIKIYVDNEEGNLDEGKKIESQVLEKKLKAVYNKVAKFQDEESIKCQDIEPSTSKDLLDNVKQFKKQRQNFPEGHPINNIKDLEKTLFGHLSCEIPPIAKRRKVLRRLERRKKRAQTGPKLISPVCDTVNRPGSLWDVKDSPPLGAIKPKGPREEFIGPKKRTMYTIRNNCIVKISENEQNESHQDPELEVALPVIDSGELPLEGTKMSLDDIKKMDMYKDYDPGIPSKVVHLSNIASTVNCEQLSLLFQQYICDNGGPPKIQLLTDKNKGQAFVCFENYDVAISVVQEINGTIVNGYPIVAKFGTDT